MSKLFDTLEKIRENEAEPESQRHRGTAPTLRQSKTNRGFDRKRLVILLCLLIVFTTSLYAGLPLLVKVSSSTTSVPDQAHRSNIVQTTPTGKTDNPISPEKSKKMPQNSGQISSSTLNSLEEAVKLNNQAVEFAKKRQFDYDQFDYGLYLLREAHEISPDAIEPLINLAVAYTEIGLAKKGMTYFEMAYKIDPIEPALLRNIAILDQAGLLKSTLITSESYEGLVAPVSDFDNGL